MCCICICQALMRSRIIMRAYVVKAETVLGLRYKTRRRPLLLPSVSTTYSAGQIAARQLQEHTHTHKFEGISLHLNESRNERLNRASR